MRPSTLPFVLKEVCRRISSASALASKTPSIYSMTWSGPFSKLVPSPLQLTSTSDTSELALRMKVTSSAAQWKSLPSMTMHLLESLNSVPKRIENGLLVHLGKLFYSVNTRLSTEW
jgi:hypothetical protein